MYYITLHCVLLYCILVKFLRNFDSMVSRSVKATPLLLLWTWKTMKSEIYVIGYRLGVRFSLQSSPLVTDSHLGLVQAHKYFFLNSDTFFQLSAVSCLKQWYVRLRSRLIKLIQSRLSFACFEIKIPNQCSILFKKIVTSKENLHFDNQSWQVVFLFLVAVFSKRNRKQVLCVSFEL